LESGNEDAEDRP
jgi:hypothetical protein